eukprot:COSAG01_NODE_6784_length_3499_cov_4.194706_5_plen_79_part_00
MLDGRGGGTASAPRYTVSADADIVAMLHRQSEQINEMHKLLKWQELQIQALQTATSVERRSGSFVGTTDGKSRSCTIS